MRFIALLIRHAECMYQNNCKTMSRRLKGQSTLQNILGKSINGQKPQSAQRSRNFGASTPAHAPAGGKVSASASAAPSPEPVAKPGYQICPVCKQPMEEDSFKFNLHLDKCLAKAADTRRRSQSTIQFPKDGTKAKAGRPSKRPKLDPSAEAGSSERSPPGDGPPSLPQGSPKRKAVKQTMPMQTRSGGKAAVWLSKTEDVEVEEDLAGDKPLGSPFQAASRIKFDAHGPGRASGDGLPEVKREAEGAAEVANTGRGGHASTSSSHMPQLGQVQLQTQAIGRRYSSSGIPHLHQEARLVHQVDNPRDENALQIVADPPGGVLGYLPRGMALHLAPLQKAGRLGSRAKVTQLGKTSSAAIDVLLELWPELPEGQDAGLEEECRQAIARAKEACEAHRGEVLERSTSSAGEMLRSNFQLLVELIVAQDRHLLSQEELDLLDTYKALPPAAQILFLRLFVRKGPWHKVEALESAGCPDPAASMAHLCTAGLAVDLASEPAHARGGVADCLTATEVADVLKAVGVEPRKSRGKPPTKAQLSEALLGALRNPTKGDETFEAIKDTVGPCARLEQLAVTTVERIQRLFFLNEGQGLNRFRTENLGVVSYPAYRVHRTRPVFADRDALLAYEACLKEAAVLDEALEREEPASPQEVTAALQPALRAIDEGMHKRGGDPHTDFLMRYSAGWVYATMATIAVNMLEREKRYKEACELLRKLLGGKCCANRRGEWWGRLTLNLDTHLKRYQEALETGEAALADEWVKNGDRLEVQRRVKRLSKRLKAWKVYPWEAAARWEPKQVTIESQPLPNLLRNKSTFVLPDGRDCSVEQFALHWYSQPENGGWLGQHAEGGIWSTLFGLLMWDALFADVPDVFRTQFQTAPLDLPTPAFYAARKHQLETCLSKVREGGAVDMLRQRWRSSYGDMCVGVNWKKYSLEELAQIVECMRGPQLAGVCSLLAQDRSSWQGGMPDLLLWSNERKAFMLSEVKGPRDSLSMQQLAWLAALSGAGIRVEVLKVREPAAQVVGKGRGRR